jgi:LuxR family transcriptional regulator, maltose regulon positive regulatory protein
MMVMPSSRSPKSKSGIPKVSALELPRSRLQNRLTSADSRLVVVLAPAGFGKTTLLAQRVRGSSRAAVWLTLTEDDAVPAALSARLGALLQTSANSVLPSWSALSAQGAAPPRLARALAEDLNALDAPLNIVLDRAECLSVESGAWLEALLLGLDDDADHRVFVAGYESTALPLARFVADGVATLIPSAELAFTLDETRDYLALRGFSGDAEAIHAKLEGWPVGLALLVAAGGSHLRPEDLVLESLRRLPPTLRDALPEAAVLEVWSEDAANALGCVLPKGWLRKAEALGLPMSALDAKRFRPHTVLLEALELELKCNTKRHAELHLRVARRAENAGHQGQAYLISGWALTCRKLPHVQAARARQTQPH